jgi:hypothetical protein
VAGCAADGALGDGARGMEVRIYKPGIVKGGQRPRNGGRCPICNRPTALSVSKPVYGTQAVPLRFTLTLARLNAILAWRPKRQT